MRCWPAVLVAVALVAVGCGSDPAPSAESGGGSATRDSSVPERTPDRGDPPNLIGDGDLLCMGPGEDEADRLEGLSYAKAERMLRSTPCTLRMVELNGVARPVTSDFLGTRINVAVRDGAIVRIDGLY